MAKVKLKSSVILSDPPRFIRFGTVLDDSELPQKFRRREFVTDPGDRSMDPPGPAGEEFDPEEVRFSDELEPEPEEELSELEPEPPLPPPRPKPASYRFKTKKR